MAPIVPPEWVRRIEEATASYHSLASGRDIGLFLARRYPGVPPREAAQRLVADFESLEDFADQLYEMSVSMMTALTRMQEEWIRAAAARDGSAESEALLQCANDLDEAGEDLFAQLQAKGMI